MNTLVVLLCSVSLSTSPVFLYVTKTSFVFPLCPRTASLFNVAVYVIVKFCVVFGSNVLQYLSLLNVIVIVVTFVESSLLSLTVYIVLSTSSLPFNTLILSGLFTNVNPLLIVSVTTKDSNPFSPTGML